jgi:hypothetical protein
MLGIVDAPPTVAGRIAFWQHLNERMSKLGNRIDAATRLKLLDAIHARIPMVTPDDVRAEQLANAQADARVWDIIAEGHAGLIASAERTKASSAPEHAKAVEEAARIKDRIARIERGEDVPGGLGRPLTLDGVMSKAEIARCRQVREVADAYGFNTLMEAIHEAKQRAERSKVRHLHRLIPYIPDDDGEDGA